MDRGPRSEHVHLGADYQQGCFVAHCTSSSVDSVRPRVCPASKWFIFIFDSSSRKKIPAATVSRTCMRRTSRRRLMYRPTEWAYYLVDGLKRSDAPTGGACPGRRPRRLYLKPLDTPERSRMAGGERRLAAIMFTDIVGYTRLSQADEPLALELLAEHRGILRP